MNAFTGGTTISHSPTTCNGTLGDVCTFECDDGYEALGEHI